jgi:hypothetical protein
MSHHVTIQVPDVINFDMSPRQAIPRTTSQRFPECAEHEFIEGSLEVKLPTIWTDEKQSREEAERRERLEERRVEEKE